MQKKKLLMIPAILYLSFGFMFALYAYSHDLRTFTCTDPRAPHGYIGMGSDSFKNPDPERCTRQGFELPSITQIPFFTVFGPPLLAARYIHAQ